MRHAIEVVTSPAYEPVHLNEAKRWCRVEESNTDHDQVLNLLIKAMRRHAEIRTHRAFISRQLRLYLEDWPLDYQYGAKICLPYPPLISVDLFRYRDADGALTTLAADQYVVHDEYEPCFIIPEWEVTWPTIRRLPDALQITFTAGYAPGSPSDEASNQEVIPEDLRVWMEARILTLFDKRDQLVINGTIEKLPHDFLDGLLDDLVIGTALFG